jgi:hypothetical protein
VGSREKDRDSKKERDGREKEKERLNRRVIEI